MALRPSRLSTRLALCSACLLAYAALGVPAAAKVSAERAAELGETRTPIGAKMAGDDQDGIPAWTGGLPQDDDAKASDDHPFEDDAPLFTITAQNVSEHAGQLSRTHRALFEQFPDTYRMPVYPTRRSAGYAQRIYDATIANATTVELTNDGNGFCCTAAGFPFPIPESGHEILWNHIMRVRPAGFAGYSNAARTAKNGDYVVQRSYAQGVVLYNRPDMTVEKLGNQYLYVMTKVTAPASLAGDAYLIHVPLDRIKETTGVWLFNQGQGRVRRVSDIGYDNPLHDGLMVHDQIDMFNGPTDRYTLKLLGRKTMIVPYNGYALKDDDLKYADIVRTGHINPEHTRYERHRVWVIEAEVREGVSHIYAKRRFYVDEDSWTIVMTEMFDERGDFWRGAEAHVYVDQTVPLMATGTQVHYDLQSRRYVVLGMRNEEDDQVEYDFDEEPSKFSPSALKRFASRRY